MKPTVPALFFFPITASPQQSKTRKSSFSKKTNKNNLFSIPSLGGPNLQQTLETPTNLPCFLGSTFLPSHPSPPHFLRPRPTHRVQSEVVHQQVQATIVDSKAPTSPGAEKPQATTGDGGRYACRQPGRVWAGLGLSYRKCVFELVDLYRCDCFFVFYWWWSRLNGYEYYRVESENIWNKYKPKDAFNSWAMTFQGLIKHTKEIQ